MESCWFDTKYDYSGSGEAVFDDPHAELGGPASVRPGENGQPIVEMSVEQSAPQIETNLDLMELQFGSRPLPGGGRAVSIGGRQNRARVTVRSDSGIFRSTPDWNYGFSNAIPGQVLTFHLRPTRSEFTADTAGQEKLMCLPVTNFVSDLPGFPATTRPYHGLADRAESIVKGIPFRIGDRPGFIEQITGADTDNAGIKTRSGDARLTAIATVPIIDSTTVDPWGWFLNVFLRLLELATGNEVGCPWFETRDECGKLVRRIHISAGAAQPIGGGYGAITKAIHWSNGEFLTAALSAAETREPFFSIALRHCIRAGLPGLTLDDQLAHVVRAMECLCARYGFGRQDLTNGLDSALKDQINGALKNARSEVQAFANTAPDLQRTSILRIAERVRSAAQVDKSFGLAVKNLAEHFGFLDFEVLRPFYAAHPGPGGRDWVQSLSYYRGAVFHEGFVDIDSPGIPVGEVLGFILHLHDLLVRLLLKIIGYRGLYQPRIVRATAAETIDWFRPGINVDGLLRVPTMGLKNEDGETQSSN